MATVTGGGGGGSDLSFWACGIHGCSGGPGGGCLNCAGIVGLKPAVENKSTLGPAIARAAVGNLSALEAIRSRKPPEPWVPSIDDWDLLPDA